MLIKLYMHHPKAAVAKAASLAKKKSFATQAYVQAVRCTQPI